MLSRGFLPYCRLYRAFTSCAHALKEAMYMPEHPSLKLPTARRHFLANSVLRSNLAVTLDHDLMVVSESCVPGAAELGGIGERLPCVFA